MEHNNNGTGMFSSRRFAAGRTWAHKALCVIMAITMVITLMPTSGFAVDGSGAKAATEQTSDATTADESTSADQSGTSGTSQGEAGAETGGADTSSTDDSAGDEAADPATDGGQVKTPSTPVLTPAETPEPQIAVMSEDEQGGISPQAGTTLSTTVSNGITTSSTEAIVDSNGLYTVTINFNSEATAGRQVVVDIPQGLRLISGTGIASVGNNTYTKAAYTPSEALIFDGYPTWASDGKVPTVLANYYSRSGTLTYPIQGGSSGGSLTLQFRAESYLYDFSGDHELEPLAVSFDGEQNNLAVHLKSIENNTVGSTLGGTATGYTDYAFPLTVTASENYPFLSPGNVQQDVIKNSSFDLTYKNGAVVKNAKDGWTLGAVTDNGNGTSTVHISTTNSVNIWTDGRFTAFWNGSITYPAAAGFAAGDANTTTISNYTWETVALQSDGTYAAVEHTSLNTPSTVQTIVQEGDWAPIFKTQQANWEAKNGYDGVQISWLSRTGMMANGSRSFTPVRFRFDADPLDNVSYVTVPSTAQGTVTNVVYKYKDEPETVWSNTDGTTMPGAITYISAGDQWGVAWRFTAEEGKAIEYAYVQYDHDEGVVVGSTSARAYGANVVVGGRPVNDAYTGTFSHHVYSTWQNSAADGSGTWTQKTTSNVASDTSNYQKFIANGNAGNDHGGFRWSEPDPFKLTETATGKVGIQSFDDTNIIDGYNRVLADFKLSNASGNTSPDPVRVDFALDTARDNVSSITFPYSYNADADEGAKQVTSLTWEYTDGSTGTWTADSGTPMPFTATTGGGVLTAPDGLYFASLSVMLDGWNASTTAVTATVTGRPVAEDNYTDTSNHTMTVTQVPAAATETQLCTGSAGYRWSQLPSNSLLVPTATSTSVNAGSAGLMTFQVNPTRGYYTHETFSIVLPSCVTPATHAVTQDQATWVGAKPINWSGQHAEGATLIGSRDATAEEIAQANANTTVDQMPADAKIYFYQVNNQDATYYSRNLGRYTYLGVQVPITVGSLAADQVYSYQQIAAFGTSLDDGQYAFAEDKGAVSSPNLNQNGGNGVSAQVIRPVAGTTLTINKDPALAVEESIAASDGVFKTYTAGDDDTVAHFMRDEAGTIKLDIFNTVESTGITVSTGYVFINIPKSAKTTATMVKENAFDFTLTDVAKITKGSENITSSEIRYLTTTTLPDALGADDLFNAGSTTFNPDATMVAIKLVWLKYGTDVVVEVPIKAPSIVSDNTIYDQWQARSVFAFQGSSVAIRDNGEKTGFLRADFTHPDWTLSFDSQGGSAVASDTVEDAATVSNYDGVTPRTTWNKPADPTWEGKTFGGWFTDAACTAGSEFDFAPAATADDIAYAKWTDNTYTVKYDTTGGTPASIDDKTAVLWNATSLLPAADPTRAGYRFAGWNTVADGSGVSVTSTTAYSGLVADDSVSEATLYAQWIELPDVTINYRVNPSNLGTVDVSTETVAPASGTPSGATVSPAAGYHLEGWYDQADAKVSEDATFVPQKSNGVFAAQTYTAKIVPNTDTAYVVHYFQQNADGNGYTEVTADKADRTGTTDTAATYDAMTYTGFGTTPDHVTHTTTTVTTAVAGAGTIAGDGSLAVNVYYNRNAHTISFDAKGHGTTPASQTNVRYGATTAAPTEPTATGYDFGGWYTDADCTDGKQWTFGTSTMPDEDVTLYAKWTAHQYTVKFDYLNQGVATAAGATLSGSDDQTVNYLGYATDACTSSMTNTTDYEFIGWGYSYTDASGTTQNGVVRGATGYTTVQVLGDVTFHAIIYKTPFVSANATNGYVAIGKDSPAAAGTSTEVSLTGVSYDNLPSSAGIKFAPQNENYALQSISVHTFLNNDTKYPGLTLSGDTLKNGTYQVHAVDKEGHEMDINVTVDLENGTVRTTNADGTALEESIGTSLEFDVVYAPIQTTYTVQHFLMGADGAYPTTATDEDTMPSATTTVNAGSAITFTPKTYTGAAYDATQTTYEDSDVTTPQTTATTVKFDGSTIVKLYYPRSTHTVTFDVQGIGTAPAALTGVYFEAEVTQPAAPTAAGYAFGGWYTDAACTDANVWDFDTDTMPNNDITLYAKWTELDDVTIDYVVAADSTGKGTVSLSTEDVAPATGTAQGSIATAATGYHFVNWTHVVNSADVEVGTAATFTPTKNAEGVYAADTYEAHFAPNIDTTYEVRYYQQNAVGSGYTEVTADKVNKTGTTAAAIDAAVLAHSYDGFNRVSVTYADSATTESDAPLTISADGSLVVRAYYNRIVYDVTFDNQGHGTTPDPLTDVRVGSAVAKPADLTAAGYTFGGWFLEDTCVTPWDFDVDTMPNNDLTLYAKWTEQGNVNISYKASVATYGTVSNASDSVKPATGTATGSTATPNAGYHFINWTDENDVEVTTDVTLGDAQLKVDGVYVAGEYTANFAPDTDTAYVVHYFQQNADGNGYTEVTADMADRTGTTDTAATYDAMTYTGFGTTPDHVTHTTTTVTTAAAGAGTIAGDGSLAVNVYYNRNAHTISFDAKGHGTTPASQTNVRYGATTAAPTEPTATGYDFGGWYTDADCTDGKEWTFGTSTMPDEDVTLYAKWTAHPYTVKFDYLNQGVATAAGATLSGNADQTVNYLSYATDACTSSMTNTTDYEFIGWGYSYTDASGTTQNGVVRGDTGYTTVQVLGDVTFHAIIYKTPFVSANATNGYVAIGEDSPTAAGTSTAVSLTGVTYDALPSSAGIKFAPQNENYVLQSISVHTFLNNDTKYPGLTLSGDTLQNGTYQVHAVDKEGNEMDINVTVDLENGTVRTTTADGSTLEESIGTSLEFDVVYAPIQTTYKVQHFLMGADGAYPTAATDEDTMPSATTTVNAGSAITFTPKTYTGAAYDATQTTYEDSAVTTPQTTATTVKFDGSTIVKLYYPRNTHDVTFDGNGLGTSTPGIDDVLYGATFAKPSDPTQPGYTFGGWYTDAACNDDDAWNFATDTMPDADKTLYAKWTENDPVLMQYTSADTVMGSVNRSQEYVSPATGTPQGSTAVPAAGYHFDKWEYTNIVDEADMDAAAATLGSADVEGVAKTTGIYVATAFTAHFAPNIDTAYKVAHYQQKLDGTYATTPTETEDKTGTTATDTAAQAKTYEGFTAQTFEQASIAGDGSTVVRINYVRNSHDVTFNANGHGTAPTGIDDVKYGATIAQPTAPTAAGYTFGGWYTDADCTDANAWNFTTGTMPDADVELFAKWTENADVTISYTVSASAAGSVDPTSESVAPATGTATGSTATANAGYHFVNWTVGTSATVAGTDATLTTAQVEAVAKTTGAYEATTFKANFAEDANVTITYQSADTTMGSVSASSESLAPATGNAAGSTATANAGYHFVNWTHVVDGTDVGVSTSEAYVPAKVGGVNVADAYTAHFAPDTTTAYKVQHFQQNIDGTYATTPTETEDKTGTTATDTAAQAKTYEGFTAQTFEQASIAGDGSTVVRINYVRNAHKVTFDVAGHGTAPADLTDVKYGATIAQPTAPTAAGFTFGGWYADKACTTEWNFTTGTMPDADLTIYAKWVEDPDVTITYTPGTGGSISSTGEEVSPATGDPSGSIATPNPGYHFVGWVNAAGDIVSTDPAFVPSKNAEGVYETETFVATFASNDPTTDDPPVSKVYKGDATADATFTFKLSAVSNTAGLETMPMPGGGTQQTMTATTTGQKAVEFGTVAFTVPGTYVYKVEEVDDGQKNWTYTGDVYTVTYQVTLEATALNSVRTITAADGTEKAAAVFANTYTAPVDPTPTPTPTPTPENKTAQVQPVAQAAKKAVAVATSAKTGDSLLYVLPVGVFALFAASGMLLIARKRTKRK